MARLKGSLTRHKLVKNQAAILQTVKLTARVGYRLLFSDLNLSLANAWS